MKQYLYTVEAARLAMFQEHDALEKQVIPHHASYIYKLVNDKISMVAGACVVRDSQHFGIVFFQAEDDDVAKSIMYNDPAVKDRVMRGCLYPFRMSLWNSEAMTLTEGQHHYFYKIRPIRPEMIAEGFTAYESNAMIEHFMYLKGLTEQGIFAFAGPTLVTDHSNFGTGLLRANNIEEAWKIGTNDPAVINRIMRLDIYEFGLIGFDASYTNI